MRLLRVERILRCMLLVVRITVVGTVVTVVTVVWSGVVVCVEGSWVAHVRLLACIIYNI
jgi:hypothetical protein